MMPLVADARCGKVFLAEPTSNCPARDFKRRSIVTGWTFRRAIRQVSRQLPEPRDVRYEWHDRGYFAPAMR
jgi:hypothetical protein